MNPYWSDESLFQEARRIVAALVQHITYNEWLPIALGRTVMQQHGLLLQQSGHCTGYDPDLNPSILNEFGASAFRWHTLIQVGPVIKQKPRKLLIEFSCFSLSPGLVGSLSIDDCRWAKEGTIHDAQRF